MGVFALDVEVAKPGKKVRWVLIKKVLVDTGSELTWLPEAELRSLGIEIFKRDQIFVTANGQRVTRDVGVALIRCGEFKTVDEVVFARPGDMLLLGARTIKGFNAIVDSRNGSLRRQAPFLRGREGMVCDG